MIALEILFLLVLLALAVPVCVFALQIGAALVLRRKLAAPLGARPTLAVLVPAHDEAAGIAATIASVRAQLLPGDRLLVVADNCTDDTGAAAMQAGAEVLTRFDAERRGKGYALDAGVRHLAQAPVQVLIVIDADCLLEAGAIELLAARSLAENRPIQALYMMRSPPGASLKTKVAEFAWAVKNRARALGYQRVGLPCQLMGTGMAFPWEQIARADLASGHIVEDLKLGLECARAGYAPRLCEQARVTSVFPANVAGAHTQRTRWEHGHLGMMLKEGPRNLFDALRSGNRDLAALTVDMCVPPLALLTLGVLALCVLGLLMWALSGHLLPWGFALINALLLGAAVLLAWAKFGRTILTFRNLAYAPIYALRKIPVYLQFLVRRQVAWVRSQRDEP